ncbi:MAG: DUF4352 domain-containing protein [Ardenticatenia bacterium]|nr:DUF4352 domain-containing protein [Ardenticatenia bacterium]
MNRKLVQGLGMFVLTITMTAATCGGSDKGATISTAVPGGAPAVDAPADAPADKPAEPAAAKIGDAVAFDDTTWTVTAAENKGQKLESDNQFIKSPETTGAFWQVEVKVANTGSDAYMIQKPKVVDDKGREFDTSSDALMILGDKACLLESINPGLEKSCTWIYEVPADAAGLGLAIKPGLLDKPTMVGLQ